MRRRLARPYGSTITSMRLLSLVMAIGVLAMLYQRVKEPAFWGWLTNEGRADSAAEVAEMPNSKAESPSETIIPGPNETDPEELIKLRSNLKGVTDRRPLEAHEMPAYWQFLRWSQTRPFAELEKTARRDVPYTQLWEQPELYRGQPIRLKLHVRRVLKYEPKDNPLDQKQLFELWGWTDDSRSFPFVVVVPEKPAKVPVGTDVDADVVFAGYFLKWMSYRAFDVTRNSPLLVGRVKPVQKPTELAHAANRWESAFLTGVIVAVTLGILVWFGFLAKRRPVVRTAEGQPIPDQLPNNWLAESSATAPPKIDVTPVDVPLNIASVITPTDETPKTSPSESGPTAPTPQ